MNRIEALAKELEREARTTRKFLERAPLERGDWRPHPKSATLAGLASHLVQCVGWTEPIFAADELDFDPKTFRPAPTDDSAALLASFDDTVSRGLAAIRGAAEPALDGDWRFKVLGRPFFERPRGAVVRDFVLSHLIHHRGQLSVYLRLLDVAVPGAYGPSADEKIPPG